MGDVTETGRTKANIKRRSIWRTPGALLAMAYVAAAVIVAVVNVPVLINRSAEAERLQRGGIAIHGTVEWSEPMRRGQSQVEISYTYQERWHKSWVYAPEDRYTAPSGIELWVDPQRSDRFATEHGDINDGVNAAKRIRWIGIFGFSGLVLGIFVFASLVHERAAGQPRDRRRAGRAANRTDAQP